jgi:hypothetical protein
MKPAYTIVCCLLTSALFACGAGDAPDSGAGEADITVAEAAQEYDAKEVVLENEPATSEGKAALGIEAWTVISAVKTKNQFAGTLAFATDAGGDVKYAVFANTQTGEVGVMIFSPEGEKRNVAPDATTERALFAEMPHLQKRLPTSTGNVHTQGVGNGTQCLAGLATAGLALAGTLAIGPALVGGTLVAAQGAVFFIDLLSAAALGTYKPSDATAWVIRKAASAAATSATACARLVTGR